MTNATTDRMPDHIRKNRRRSGSGAARAAKVAPASRKSDSRWTTRNVSYMAAMRFGYSCCWVVGAGAEKLSSAS